MNSESELLRSNWNKVIENSHLYFNINDVVFNNFVKYLYFKDLVDDTVIISIDLNNKSANTEQTKNYIEKTLSDTIKEAINYTIQSGKDYNVKFVLGNGENHNGYNNIQVNNNTNSQIPAFPVPSYNNQTNIYTFDNFIAGEENAIVYAACLNVADNPGNINTNPLFIYGNSGLGKTHLMHAIENRIRENDNSKNVCYVTSEAFTNEIIEAIRNNKGDNTSTKNFRSKYRNVDVLLIDDIQSMIGKEAVQNEFFNTFNALYDQQKQIVLSSDKPPKDLKILEERLSSRLLYGYTVDVKTPTYETRMAILRQKLEEENITGIDNEILDFIANNVSSNIRELQGAMKRIIMNYKFKGSALTLDDVKVYIADLITTGQAKSITIDLIVDIVCSQYDVTRDDILGTSKKRSLTIPRQLIMYISNRYIKNTTYEKIGEKLGGRDHSTIMYGSDQIKKQLSDPESNQELVYNYNEVLKKMGVDK